jgi:hypothetical protein
MGKNIVNGNIHAVPDIDSAIEELLGKIYHRGYYAGARLNGGRNKARGIEEAAAQIKQLLLEAVFRELDDLYHTQSNINDVWNGLCERRDEVEAELKALKKEDNGRI